MVFAIKTRVAITTGDTLYQLQLKGLQKIAKGLFGVTCDMIRGVCWRGIRCLCYQGKWPDTMERVSTLVWRIMMHYSLASTRLICLHSVASYLALNTYTKSHVQSYLILAFNVLVLTYFAWKQNIQNTNLSHYVFKCSITSNSVQVK